MTARIHGYKYYYINTVDPGDRRASWKKPTVISKILKEHDVCIYLDSDAIFHHLNLPFEWLMNYWTLSPDNNAMALAVDPDTEGNKDRYGKLNLNTGFIISQNNPTTYKIMDAWNRCPDDDGPYPGCEVFRKNTPGQPTDQGGFAPLFDTTLPTTFVSLAALHRSQRVPRDGLWLPGRFHSAPVDRKRRSDQD